MSRRELKRNQLLKLFLFILGIIGVVGTVLIGGFPGVMARLATIEPGPAGTAGSPATGSFLFGFPTRYDELSSREKVEKVGIRLASHSSSSRYTFSFKLLPDRRFANAFVMPTGQIYITEGLVRNLQSEGELAAVLSHEMGHILADSAGRYLGNGLQDLSSGGSGLSVEQHAELERRRAKELRADFLGICIMSSAGYDPQHFVDLMEVLDAALPESERSEEYLSDHPAPENRIAHILDTIEHLERCP